MDMLYVSSIDPCRNCRQIHVIHAIGDPAFATVKMGMLILVIMGITIGMA